MTCPRCSGLMLYHDELVGGYCIPEYKCANCGHGAAAGKIRRSFLSPQKIKRSGRGRPRYGAEIIDRIKELLRHGDDKRDIAYQVGVSVNFVYQVARGEKGGIA